MKKKIYRDKYGRFAKKSRRKPVRRIHVKKRVKVRSTKGKSRRAGRVRQRVSRRVQPKRVLRRKRIRRVRRVVVRPSRRTRVVRIKRKRVRTVVRWETIREWITSLENKYGALQAHRSDPPQSRLRWVKDGERFLWHERRYPPLHAETRYIVLENWYVVYDENEDAFYLWVQRRMLGSGMTLSKILKSLPGIIYAQKEKLNSNSYIQVRAHAGWTTYPLANWDKVRLGRK